MISAGISPVVVAIVLNWHDEARTIACLAGLLTDDNIAKVYVIDNEARGDMRASLRNSDHTRVELIEVTENRGFSGGINEGLRVAKDADAVLVINNDATIDPGAIGQLVERLLVPGRTGIVAPVILNPDGTVQSRGGRISRLSGIARQNYSETVRLDYLSWACVLVRGELLRTLGELDERFFMYWEDVDYSLRARRAGYALEIVDAAKVRHELSASASTAGRRLATYYAWSLLVLGDIHGGWTRVRSRIGVTALLAARMVRRDWPGVRAIRRACTLSRSDQSAWRVVLEQFPTSLARSTERGE